MSGHQDQWSRAAHTLPHQAFARLSGLLWLWLSESLSAYEPILLAS